MNLSLGLYYIKFLDLFNCVLSGFISYRFILYKILSLRCLKNIGEEIII